MVRFLLSTLVYLIANAVGLLVAIVVLTGFNVDALSFVAMVLLFSLFQTIINPLLTKISENKLPQLAGGVALITVLLGLLIVDFLLPGMEMGGVSNWLAATLLVWIGSLIAGIFLPIFVFKKVRENRKSKLESEINRATNAAERAESAAQSIESNRK